MEKGLLKIGTMPTLNCDIYGNKPLYSYRNGEYIKFRVQGDIITGKQWYQGIVTGFCAENIPMVEYK